MDNSVSRYYCTVHRDEDQSALLGEKLDASTSHMVFDTGYDLAVMRDIIANHPWKVLWQMRRDPLAKFGWRFDAPVGIPR